MTKQTEELNVRKISKDNEILQVEQRKEDLSAEKKINADEIEEINVEKENAYERERSLQEKLASYNQQHNELKQKIEEQSRLVEEKEKLTKAFQDEMTSLKVDLAQKQEKRDGLNESLKKLSADQREMQEQMKNIANEYQLCQKKIQDTEKETEHLREKAAELQSQKAVLDESIRNLKSEKEKQEESVADLKAKREEHHTEYTQAEQLLQDTKLKENEYHIRMTNLEERVREEYKLEISEVDASTEEIQLELSKPDESGNTEAGFWDAVSQEIEMLQGKVERLGNVNLEAISEQDELEQREIFLLNQKEDLENSHTTLQNLIKKINHTSRESLEKVFYEIRRNFQAMFRKLFGGGKADIILEENVDILEAGIEIIVQPPNKELRSITLLSGGEKVMVTIALLFAVFQTKPSPFCILDEVDAALDESNINRFQLVIKEFTKDAQFLVITHNKVTMSIADVLYGITMQEPGVSKKVAVKFEEIEKKVA